MAPPSHYTQRREQFVYPQHGGGASDEFVPVDPLGNGFLSIMIYRT